MYVCVFLQDGHSDHAAERDMESEYARQRELLERSVASLRKKLAKDTEIHRKESIRVMQVMAATLRTTAIVYMYIPRNKIADLNEC